MENRSKVISTIAIVAIVIATVTATIPTADASGGSDGKRRGHNDAMDDKPMNTRCPTGNDNDYCLGYRSAYTVEYLWTRLMQK